MKSKVEKLVQTNKEQQDPVLSLDDRSLSSLTDISRDFSQFTHITELVLAHNKLTKITQAIGDLRNLRLLNVFNNQVDELPANIHELRELRHLNLGMNRLKVLPIKFREIPKLEMLDLTYNNFTEETVGTHFWDAGTPLSKTLRVLYLSDNDFHFLPMKIKHLEKLEILSLRDNDILYIPEELHMLKSLHELHLQGNLIRLLPPSFGLLKENLVGQKKVVKLERNHFIPHLEAKRKQGLTHFFHYLNSEDYKILYQREVDSGNSVRPSAERQKEKSKKACRVKA